MLIQKLYPQLDPLNTLNNFPIIAVNPIIEKDWNNLHDSIVWFVIL